MPPKSLLVGKRCSVMVPAELHRRLRIAAATAGCQLQDIVVPVLEAEVVRREKA